MATTDPAAQKALVGWGIAMTALAVVILWCAYLVREVLLLIYVSGLLAIGFSPIVRLIERQKALPIGTRRFPRWLAILTLYLFILGTLTGIGFMIVPPLVHQGQQLWTALPDMFDRGQEFLIQKGILKEHLTLREAVARAPKTGSGQAVGTVMGAVVGVVGGLFGLLTILILTFYILVEADNLRDTMLRLFPRRNRTRVAAASRDITMKVSAWLGGQLLLGAIIGGSSALGLWLLGIPFFYVLALISGIGELIPVVGPILAAIPAIIVASTVSLNKAILVILFFIVQQQFENHVLVPKIMERQVGVSAVTVIIALLIGGKLLGIPGAILAVPSAAILQVLFTEFTTQRDRA
ncbi:MAG TPA: AI-2E family transporter [Vicinamibacterales bacterium]|nr:AI-2E family transporter [Vicinamibacterales bacterium]